MERSIQKKNASTKFSVPQGSCSSPTLFCLYSGTLPSALSKSVTLSAFPDDHTVYKNFNPDIKDDEHNTILDLENNLQKVWMWMSENRLKINPSKTEFIKFGSRQQLISLDVHQSKMPKCKNVKI